MKKKCIIALLSLWSISASHFSNAETYFSNAETYYVSIGATTNYGIPDKVAEIKEVLASTGLDIEYVVQSDQRSNRDFVSGKHAISLHRSDFYAEIEPNVLQVPTPVDALDAWMWSGSAELCQIPLADRYNSRMLGLQGIAFYDYYIYPEFNNYLSVSNQKNAAKLLIRGRADYTIWTKPGVNNLEDGDQLHLCDSEPYLTVYFYTFVHPNYKHLVPIIDASYKAHFSDLKPR